MREGMIGQFMTSPHDFLNQVRRVLRALSDDKKCRPRIVTFEYL